MEAQKAYAIGETPIGAVVVKDGEIIGRGHNLREKLADASAHAEMIAMRMAAQSIGDWRLNDVSVYVTLEPCPMCAGAMLQFRVKTLVYGAQDHKSGAVDSVMDIVREPRFNHQTAVISGVLEIECRELLQKFFRELRSKHK